MELAKTNQYSEAFAHVPVMNHFLNLQSASSIASLKRRVTCVSQNARGTRLCQVRRCWPLARLSLLSTTTFSTRQLWATDMKSPLWHVLRNPLFTCPCKLQLAHTLRNSDKVIGHQFYIDFQRKIEGNDSFFRHGNFQRPIDVPFKWLVMLVFEAQKILISCHWASAGFTGRWPSFTPFLGDGLWAILEESQHVIWLAVASTSGRQSKLRLFFPSQTGHHITDTKTCALLFNVNLSSWWIVRAGSNDSHTLPWHRGSSDLTPYDFVGKGGGYIK